MKSDSLDIIILGLSLSSSWGNGHATTYRSLIKGLHEEGHRVTFLERDIEWYASNRDMESSPWCNLFFYEGLEDLTNSYLGLIKNADVVIAGSYLKEGVEIGELVTEEAGGVTAFYDIDTPVTLARLEKQNHEYISPELIPRFDLYLSFSGGVVLELLEEKYHASSAKPLYCSVDTDLYYPETRVPMWILGYLGTFSEDRQPTLENLLLETARRHYRESFVVAGPQYPPVIEWPENVRRIEHLPPARHREFYNEQVFTLNVTRTDMIHAGYSPSVRLFEAAACGTPIISDSWNGMDAFFEPGEEILIARTTEDVQKFVKYPAKEINRISEGARQRVLQNHTSRRRAGELAGYIKELKKVAV